MDVVVSGASGLIGSALKGALEAGGHRMVPMTRSQGGGEAIHWDPESGAIDAGALEGVGAVVHLAGEGIGNKRWNAEQKARIKESRRVGTTLLCETLAKLQKPPKVLVSGSAVGYYGDRGDEVLTESSRPGNDFLAEVCLNWEGATAPAKEAGVRVAHIRTGIVLSGRGGVLPRMLTPFKFGVGGKLGSGAQWVSWIAIEDEVRAIVHLIENDALSGAFNLTAPNPLTNADLTKAIGAALHRPTLIPAPGLALKLALGTEMAEELLLVSQRALPTRLLDSGFTFKHPEIDEALKTALAEAS
jgi:uncharacterized protein